MYCTLHISRLIFIGNVPYTILNNGIFIYSNSLSKVRGEVRVRIRYGAVLIGHLGCSSYSGVVVV
jgi:hypothetical protein